MKLYLNFFLLVLLLSLISIQSSYGGLPVVTFWKKHTPNLSFSTVVQTVSTGACSGVVSVVNKTWLGVQSTVSSNVTLNLSGDGSITFYSESNCENLITSATILSGTSSKSFYFISTSVGSAVINVTATGYKPISQTHTIVANNFLWTGGGGDSNWSTGANWSGGVAPGSSNTAIFDSTCSTNCSPTINSNINVKGVRIYSGYFGTISQTGSNTITIGNSGWYQTSGTFIGSVIGSAISMNGNFTLNGGYFTSTSGTFTNGLNWSISATSTFLHNNGSLFLSGTASCAQVFINPGNLEYNNVTLSPSSCSYYSLNNNTMAVNGNLILGGSALGDLSSGTINAKGEVTFNGSGIRGSSWINITGTSNQTITGVSSAYVPNLNINSTGGTVTFNGTLNILNEYKYSSGIVDTITNSNTLYFTGGNGCVTYSTVPGVSVEYNNVTFGGTSCSYYNFNGGSMIVKGTLAINNTSSAVALNNGNINAFGNVSIPNSGFIGNGWINIVGTSNQTITGVQSGKIPNLKINSTGGTVTFVGTLGILYDYNYTSGFVDAISNARSLYFTGGNSCATYNITPGAGINYYNLTMGSSQCSHFSLGGSSMNILGSLIFDSGSPNTIDNGTLVLSGALTALGNGIGGTAAISFSGTTNQIINQAIGSRFPTGAVTINNSNGITLASNVTWNGTSQTVDLILGTISQGGSGGAGGYNLTLKNLNLNGNILTKNGGVLTVNGSVAGTGNLFGGTVNP